MFENLRIPVADFLRNVEQEFGNGIADLCRAKLEDRVTGHELQSILAETLDRVLTVELQSELQEAARLEEVPFTSYPD